MLCSLFMKAGEGRVREQMGRAGMMGAISVTRQSEQEGSLQIYMSISSPFPGSLPLLLSFVLLSRRPNPFLPFLDPEP